MPSTCSMMYFMYVSDIFHRCVHSEHGAKVVIRSVSVRMVLVVIT